MRKKFPFLLFLLLIFSSLFFIVSVYLSSFFLGAHPPSDLYWLGKIQPTYSQTLPAAAQCCQSFILYFPLRRSSSFFSDGRRRTPRKKRDDDAEVLGPSRKVVSSPPEKIWKYFPINLFTLNKKREREKGTETVHTLWQLHFYSEKHIKCRNVLLPLSFRVKPCCCAVSTRRIHRLTDADW